MVHQQNAGIHVLGWPALGSVCGKDTQCAASRWRPMLPNIKDLSGGSGMKSKILGRSHTERADYQPASRGITLEPKVWPASGISAMGT